jgi:hypothetical protein
VDRIDPHWIDPIAPAQTGLTALSAADCVARNVQCAQGRADSSFAYEY